MIPRPSRSGESLFMTSLETSQILLFLYHCPHQGRGIIVYDFF